MKCFILLSNFTWCSHSIAVSKFQPLLILSLVRSLVCILACILNFPVSQSFYTNLAFALPVNFTHEWIALSWLENCKFVFAEIPAVVKVETDRRRSLLSLPFFPYLPFLSLQERNDSREQGSPNLKQGVWDHETPLTLSTESQLTNLRKSKVS